MRSVAVSMVHVDAEERRRGEEGGEEREEKRLTSDFQAHCRLLFSSIHSLYTNHGINKKAGPDAGDGLMRRGQTSGCVDGKTLGKTTNKNSLSRVPLCGCAPLAAPCIGAELRCSFH